MAIASASEMGLAISLHIEMVSSFYLQNIMNFMNSIIEVEEYHFISFHVKIIDSARGINNGKVSSQFLGSSRPDVRNSLIFPMSPGGYYYYYQICGEISVTEDHRVAVSVPSGIIERAPRPLAECRTSSPKSAFLAGKRHLIIFSEFLKESHHFVLRAMGFPENGRKFSLPFPGAWKKQHSL
jgi:hypothetical protein